MEYFIAHQFVGNDSLATAVIHPDVECLYSYEQLVAKGIFLALTVKQAV